MRVFGTIRRLIGRGLPRRRGSVILLALGVLAIISIAALAYVTIVRLDRAASIAVFPNYDRQVETVIAEIGSVIVADLFENKIVTDQTLRVVPGVPQRNWPAMFGDGEARDVPTIELATFNTKPDPFDETAADDPAAVLAPGVPPRSDDAWLASTEPDWNISEPNLTAVWPQITNLRSAYRWRNNRWVRDDGRFADLGSWFFASRDNSNFADPSVNLIDWSSPRVVRLGPDQGTRTSPLGDTPVRVFNRQMNAMGQSDTAPFTGPLTPSDERRWVDTDGDLRPDARWTVLDSLGNLHGLNWVVACRIIDASALVNINTALEFGSPTAFGGPERLAEGRTPSDVDLVRLLSGAARGANNPFPLPVRTDRLLQNDGAFSQHLRDGLALPAVIAEIMQDIDPMQQLYPDLTQYVPWRLDERLTREQRRLFWEFFGRNPMRPLSRAGVGYPGRDMADLMAFWGTNNPSILSRVEQQIDGPAVNGYLPGDTSANAYGPLRSKENADDIRRFVPIGGNPVTDQRPSGRQIHDSARRFLTTVSGAGRVSPVPVLNNDLFPGVFHTEKVRIDRPLSAEEIARAFESFVWALAPLLTDRPLTHGLLQSGSFGIAARELHYGGGDRGPAQRLYGAGTDTGGSYAVITAASMAANLAAAISTDPRPVLVRMKLDDPNLNLRVREEPNEVHLGLNLRQGRINRDALPVMLDGGVGGTPKDYLFIGTKRRPFLAEAVTMVVLSGIETPDGATDLGAYKPTLGQGVDGWRDAIGSLIAVELYNPWPDAAVVTRDYTIVIPETPEFIDDLTTLGEGPIVLDLPDGVQIQPGERRLFVWMTRDYAGPGSAWGEVRDAILGPSAMPQFGVLLDDLADDAAEPDRRVPFWHMMANPAPRPVLLMERDPDFSTNSRRYLIDRLSPPTNDPGDPDNHFPPAVNRLGTLEGFTFSTGFTDNVLFGFNLAYLNTLGYTSPETDPRLGNYTGRLLITSSLTRPFARSGATNGADSFIGGSGFGGVLEFGPTSTGDGGRNVVHTRRYGHAWLAPYDAFNDPPAASADAPRDIINGEPGETYPFDFANDTSSLNPPSAFASSVWPKRADEAYPNLSQNVAPYELFVPRGPLLSPSEVLLIGAHANSCRFADDLDGLNDLRNWRTVGEKMALTVNYDNSLTSLSGLPDDANTWLGVLDPSRFVINQMGGFVGGLPDTMSIPLALRVPDCFDAVGKDATLVQGLININTAPIQVLQTLPLVEPQFEIASSVGAPGALPQATQGASRANMMEWYRRREGPNNASAAPFRPQGLRQPPTFQDFPEGFGTPAELAVMGDWIQSAGRPSGAQPDTFLALGADTAPNTFSPLAFEDRVRRLTPPNTGDPLSWPLDGPQEMHAIYRAVSNIATARSDVFIAWFVLRGYDPQVIESIEVNWGGADDERTVNNTMDDPENGFGPAYESRWLVVYDRSQTDGGSPIRRPTDRPRVLMRIELPPARP